MDDTQNPDAAGNSGVKNEFAAMMIGSQEESTAETAAKRAAFAGQWRTPPLPVFANHAAKPSVESMASVPAAAEKLPVSTEDYVKALQEAYLRGAEAAQAMAQQSTGTGEQPASTPAPVQAPVPTNTPSMSQSVAPILPVPVQVPNPLVPVAPSEPASAMPPPSAHPSAIKHPGALGQQQQQQQQRSLSLPDMRGAAGLSTEEAKRQKRLARNRASARLRRLRKKNLVDAYESEVGLLEQTLAKLKAHQWGQNPQGLALQEALSMDRGQQELSAKERQQAAMDILDQQSAYISQLQQALEEQYTLYQVATSDGPELEELRNALQLSPEQRQQIKEQHNAGWEEEWAALQTVQESLQAMRHHDWLWNNNSSITEPFMSLLHKNQVCKFLQWADHNSDAMDELDGVRASASSEPPHGPVFTFGIDVTPATTAAMRASGGHED